jgi:hypothetical protein
MDRVLTGSWLIDKINIEWDKISDYNTGTTTQGIWKTKLVITRMGWNPNKVNKYHK